MTTINNIKELLSNALHSTFPTLAAHKVLRRETCCYEQKSTYKYINWENLIIDSYDTVIFNA